MKNRDVTSALMAFTVVWNMYGFANSFFERAWRGAPLPVTPISYLLNAALVVFAPLARSGKRWIALASTVLGVLMALWSTVGVFFMSDEEVEMAPGIPGGDPGLRQRWEP